MVDRNDFGPKMWGTIHFIALGYPNKPSEENKKQYQAFYEGLVNVIPCEECSKHLRDNLQKVDIVPYLKSSDSLFEWTVKLHNVVNVMLGKPEWTLEKAKQYYMKGNYSLYESLKCVKNRYVLFIIIVGIIGGYLVYNNSGKLRKKLRLN
jgi:hypothetical protein